VIYPELLPAASLEATASQWTTFVRSLKPAFALDTVRDLIQTCEDRILLLTDERIVYVKVSTKRVRWALDLRNIVQVTTAYNGLIVYYSNRWQLRGHVLELPAYKLLSTCRKEAHALLTRKVNRALAECLERTVLREQDL